MRASCGVICLDVISTIGHEDDTYASIEKRISLHTTETGTLVIGSQTVKRKETAAIDHINIVPLDTLITIVGIVLVVDETICYSHHTHSISHTVSTSAISAGSVSYSRETELREDEASTCCC